jgi:carbon-monoxide dehydrogenase large subunit
VGSVGIPPAIVNAVLDALAPCGVTRIDMPCTAERIWRVIQQGVMLPPSTQTP